MNSGSPEDRIITIVVLEPNSEGAESLANAVSGNQYCEVIRVQSPQEAVQIVIQSQPCLVVTSFLDQQTIMNSMILLKGIHGLTKRGRVKSVVVSKLKAPQLRSATQKLSVSEYMEEPVPARTIQFKANIQIKAVDAIKKKDAEQRARDEKIQLKQGELKKAKEEYSSDATMKPQLGVKGDSFTFKGCQTKKKGKNTSFNLGGPDPASGDWVQHESEEEGKTAWRWVPNDEEEKKAAGGKDGKDGWIADGDKPTFNAAKKKWEFSAEKPRVYKRKDGEVEAEKVKTDADGKLEVAMDSEEATESVNKGLKELKDRQEKEAKQKNSKLKQKPENKEVGEKKDSKLKQKPDSDKDRLKNLLDDDDDLDEDKTHGDLGNIASSKKVKESKKSGFGLEDQMKKSDEEKNRLNDLRESEEDEAEEGANPDQKEKRKVSKRQSLKDRLAEGDKEGDTTAGDLNDKRGESDEEAIGLQDKRSAEEESEEPTVGNKKYKPKGKSLRDKLVGDEDNEELSLDEEVSASELNDKRSTDKEDRLSGLRDRLSKSEEDEDPDKSHGKLDATVSGKTKEIKKSGFDVAEQIGKSQEEAKKKKAAELKKKLLEEAKKEAAKPLKDKLTSEERAEIEKELGVEASTESDAELAKKHKKAKLKKMMDRMKELDDLDFELGEEKGAFNVHDLKKDDIENTQSQRSLEGEEEKPKWSGRDSDQEDPEVEWKGHKSKGGKTDSSIKTKKSDKEAYYISQEELDVEGAAWEHSENFFICISAETKYRGYKELSELLPIWIFAGEEKPEFLDKDKRWRFYGEEAQKIDDIKDLPIEVKDFFDAMNEQLKTGISKDPRLREKNAELDQLAGKRKDKEDRLAALKNALDSDPEPTPEEAAEEGFDLGEFKAKKKAQFSQEHDELAAELEELRSEEDNKKKEFASAILEANVEDVEGENEGRLYQKEAKKKPSTAEQLEKKVKSSEAAEFLKKRKSRGNEKIGSKQAEMAKERADAIVNAKETPKSVLGETIAIDLLLSDSIFDGKDLIAEPKKLLNTISDRFRNTKSSLIIAENDTKGAIAGSSHDDNSKGNEWNYQENPSTPEKEFINSKLHDSETRDTLGFLALRPLEPRKSFTEDDVRILSLISESLSNYWTSINRKNKKDDAA